MNALVYFNYTKYLIIRSDFTMNKYDKLYFWLGLIRYSIEFMIISGLMIKMYNLLFTFKR